MIYKCVVYRYDILHGALIHIQLFIVFIQIQFIFNAVSRNYKFVNLLTSRCHIANAADFIDLGHSTEGFLFPSLISRSILKLRLAQIAKWNDEH